MELMDEIPTGSFTPRFQETYLRRAEGSLRRLADLSVAERTDDEPAKWEGANLEVIKADELPKYARFMSWLPRTPIEIVTVLRRL